MRAEILTRPGWWVAVILLLVHQVLQYGLGYSLRFIDDYLDPVLSIPILLGILLQERRWYFGVRRLGWVEVGITATVLALVFEFVFPWLEPRFVYDAWDFVAYAVGLGWYGYFVSPPDPPAQ